MNVTSISFAGAQAQAAASTQPGRPNSNKSSATDNLNSKTPAPSAAANNSSPAQKPDGVTQSANSAADKSNAAQQTSAVQQSTDQLAKITGGVVGSNLDVSA